MHISPARMLQYPSNNQPQEIHFAVPPPDCLIPIPARRPGPGATPAPAKGLDVHVGLDTPIGHIEFASRPDANVFRPAYPLRIP
ncbi:MAG: hypothetical protein R3E96_05175 [Planctomycetota bacterium]